MGLTRVDITIIIIIYTPNNNINVMYYKPCSPSK